MTNSQPMEKRVEELLELAREKTSQARRRLFENLTDLFLSEDGRLNEHERALMNDILSKLVRSVELRLRQELAEFFARNEIDLPDIVRLLANDEIEVARPLLASSKLLRDEDLIEIVRMRTDEHRLTIAMREEISEAVTTALVEYGNGDVLEALLRNPDSKINDRAMEYLVAESRRVDRFQEPLVGREDLPPELAYRMYWWVAASLRKRIVADFDVDPLVVDQAMRHVSRSMLGRRESGEGAYIKAQRLVRRLAETGDLTPEFLLGSLRQNRIPVFVAGLAELGSIDFRTAWRIFSDPGGESLAVLAKAVGLERGQFTSVFLLVREAREGRKARSPATLKRILELFDLVSPANARGALQYWQQDSAYHTALEGMRDVG